MTGEVWVEVAVWERNRGGPVREAGLYLYRERGSGDWWMYQADDHTTVDGFEDPESWPWVAGPITVADPVEKLRRVVDKADGAVGDAVELLREALERL